MTVSINLDLMTKEKLPKHVYIFDTTLRDGEQTPGVCYTLEEKIEIAKQLDELGVDVIEAGFPVNSEDEKRTVKKIAKEGLRAKICGLARCSKVDVDACLEAEVDRIHLFIASSDVHLKYKLKISKEEAIARAVEFIEYVKSHGLQCEFSCEDATRTERNFLIEFYKKTVEAGADIINIPDTVGVMEPECFYKLVSAISSEINVPISVHCHNDFGLAVANTLAGVKAGASQVQVTVNGLGERAGNASLEQVVTALELIYGVKTNIKLELLTKTSQLIQKYSMIQLPPNYPIVGLNAFSHEAGIHVHGILARAECYEPFPPELVGQKRRIVLGKHTGKHAVKSYLSQFYGEIPEDKLLEIVNRIKKLSAFKKKIVEDDVLAIAEETLGRVPEAEKEVKLKEIVVVTGNTVSPTALLHLKIKNETRVAASDGIGPVDAAAKAIQKALGERIRLLNYKLEAISGGTDSLASVEVVVEDDEGRKARGVAVSGDIVMASVDALIEGINRLRYKRSHL